MEAKEGTSRWGMVELVPQGSRQSLKWFTESPPAVYSLDPAMDTLLVACGWVAKRGEWRTDGLGNKFVVWGKVRWVLIPGARQWRIKRARVMQASLEETVDDGSFHLGPNQMEDMFGTIGAGFLEERGTGISLERLLAPIRLQPPEHLP